MARNPASEKRSAKRSASPGRPHRAEARTGNQPAHPDKIAPGETHRLLHDLKVHQIELEMQNEELRRAQQELEESRAKYVDLFDFAPVGYLTLSAKGLILEANLTAATLLGVEKSLLLKTPLTRFIVKQDRDIYYRHRKQVFETRARQQCELRMVRKGGDPFWVYIAAMVLEGQDDSAGWRATLVDITERKQAEENTARLVAIVESSEDAILSKTLDGIITSWNIGAERLYGYTEREMLGRHVSILAPPDRADEMSQILEKIGRGSRVGHFETVRQRKDGQRVDVSLSISPIRNAQGSIIGASAIEHDVTERRQLEQQLEYASETLQTRLNQMHELQEQLRELAVRDPLTQLYNRRYLNGTLPREIALALRQSYAIGILMLDIDHFKNVNDTYGHSSGDEALQAIAHSLTTHLRASDIICRYGGEEFLCLLLNTTREIALQRAEQLRAAIADLPIVSAHPNTRVTVSIGVALFPPHGSDVIAILKAADEALYQAKADGRNCVRLAQSDQPL